MIKAMALIVSLTFLHFLSCFFKEKHGHCHVRQAIETFELGQWANNQRDLYRRRAKILMGTRYEKLLDLGFDFETDQAPWHNRYDQLVRFYKQYGHTDVPETNKVLCRWMVTQRDLYRKNCRIMLGHRQNKLMEIGFQWEPKQATSEKGRNSPPALNEECGGPAVEPWV
jgi:hypothetical protein